MSNSASAAVVTAARKVVRQSIGGLRFYQVEGIALPFPSVTTVLSGTLHKPLIKSWSESIILGSFQRSLISRRAEVAYKAGSGSPPADFETFLKEVADDASGASDRIRDSAGDFGTRAHELIEKVMLNRPVEGFGELLPDEMRPVVIAARKFRDETDLEILRGDSIVYSEKHGFAGAFDALARHKQSGDLVLLDWKTSNSVRIDYALQLAAYAHALEELEGQKVDQAWVVKFNKSRPMFEIHKVNNLEISFELFRSCLRLWVGMQSKLFEPPRTSREFPWTSKPRVPLTYEPLLETKLS